MKRFISRAVEFYWGSGIADDVPALTYYLVLSLAPFALGVGALVTLLFGQNLQPAEVVNEVSRFLPASVRGDIIHLVLTTKHESARLLALATVAMLWTTSGAIGVIERCTARLTGAPRLPIITGRLRNIALGGALSLLLILSVAGASLAGGLRTYLPGGSVTMARLAEAGNFLGSTLFCALIFRFVTRGGMRWRSAFTGALPTATILVMAPLVIGLYFSALTHPAAAGLFFSLAVVLLGCFVLAVGLLVGVGVAARAEQRAKKNDEARLSAIAPEVQAPEGPASLRAPGLH